MARDIPTAMIDMAGWNVPCIPKMKEGAMVTFFGPKAEARNLPLAPISDYIFRLRRFVPQIRK